MKIPRPAALAALALAIAGCTDRPVPTAAPDAPARRSGYVTSVNVQCPGSIAVGGYGSCSAYAWDSNGGYTDRTFSAQWYGNGAVYVYSFGGIQGVAAGTGWVYASVDGVQGWTTVNVYTPPPPPVPTSMTVTPGGATVATGHSAGFTARVNDQNGNQMSGQPISWSSSNSSVATVDAGGSVTGVAPGSATITATSGSLSASASVTVVQGFTVEILGGSQASPGQECTFYAEVTGGTAPFSYSFSSEASETYSSGPLWSGIGGSDYYVDVAVTDANGVTIPARRRVTVMSGGDCAW